MSLEPDNITLDLLFVMPLHQRKKLATNMVSFGVNQLYEDGVREIYSDYHICSDNSRKWHHSFGFEEVYDQFYFRLKYSWCRHEIWRHEKLGLDDDKVVKALSEERDYWHSQSISKSS